MTKVEQARDIFESSNTDATRMQIIKRIMKATDSGEAYSSTLYNKARKLSVGVTQSGNKEAFEELGNKLGITRKVDDAKDAFVKNCWKIQGIKGCHYGVNLEIDGIVLTVTGISKTGTIVVVKAGTKVKVKNKTAKVMTELRKMKFLGKK